ncbi:PEP-CTERM sorting domain-containing protein [Microcystis aeruginosa]|nr:PEP-CTERM sorting domain-containing protein [Microcystis aeruginosa]
MDFTPLATPVPEPSSLLGLLAIGALGAGAAWKRKLK